MELPSLSDVLFSTNKCPTDEERKELNEIVMGFEEKLTQINSKIRELETQIKALNEEKEELLRYADPYKRSLSPFRRLPQDVIREIFVACLPTNCNPTMASTSGPMLLTQISRGTRSIAISTPALWSSIHIPIIGEVPQMFLDQARAIMGKRAEGVREFLGRSGCLPLNISVYAHSDGRFADEGLHEEIINILIGCCTRWKNVYLACHPHHLTRIAALSRTDVPHIRSMYLYPNSNLHSNDPCIWTGSSLLSAPTLTSFGVFGSWAMTARDYPVKWENLTKIVFPEGDLHIDTNYTTKLATILRNTRRLTSCHVSVRSNASAYINDIHLPLLKHLVVREIDGDFGLNFNGLLSAIHAPRLEALVYNPRLNVPRSACLSTFLCKQMNITELSMGFIEEPSILEEYLPSLPALRILNLGKIGDYTRANGTLLNKYLVDKLLDRFVAEDALQCLCPELEYFRCQYRIAVSVSTLLNFITRKTGAVSHLKPWKGVVMGIDHDPADNAMVDAIDFDELTGDTAMQIEVEFQPRASLSHCDDGLPEFSEVDEWWPSGLEWPMVKEALMGTYN